MGRRGEAIEAASTAEGRAMSEERAEALEADAGESARFLSPRYWPTWVFLGCMVVVRAALPFRVQLALGRWLGAALHGVAGRARQTARRNISLCFPELGGGEVRRLTRRTFESLGMQLFETSYCWGKPDSALLPLANFKGLEHLEQARAGGRGVVLVTGHFAALEIAGILLAIRIGRFQAMYRPQRANPLLDAVIYRGRTRGATMLEKYAVRKMIAALRAGEVVLYLADQAYRRKRSAVLPFFSQPAMTNTSVSYIARLSGARVVPFLPLRRADGRYDVELLPALEGLPTGDPLADTLRINRVLEEHIRRDPSQYLWVHKRFKGLPPGYPDVYAREP